MATKNSRNRPKIVVIGQVHRLVVGLEQVARRATGPVPSFEMSMSVVTSVKTVGSKKV